MSVKKIKILFFASLREAAGTSEIEIETEARTPIELYSELNKTYDFSLALEQLKVAVNDEFVEMTVNFKENDSVVFIPPVAGG